MENVNCRVWAGWENSLRALYCVYFRVKRGERCCTTAVGDVKVFKIIKVNLIKYNLFDRNSIYTFRRCTRKKMV